MEKFDLARKRLEAQYWDVKFDPASGLSKDELKAAFKQHCAENPGEPRILTRAWLFHLICTQARIAPDKDDYFVDKVDHGELLNDLRRKWWQAAELEEFGHEPHPSPGSIEYLVDLSHTSPDWVNILKLGFPGLRARAAQKEGVFHKAVAMVYDGAMKLCRRLGEASDNPALTVLAERPPQTLREAFQLAYLFHELQEMEGENVRTMGWFDRLYINYYRQDLKAGRLTRDEAKELIKYFWIKFYAKTQGKLFGKNFCFGPEINELSYLGMEVYYEMHTVDPKLSVRVTAATPVDFLESIARCIRDGKTGIVLLNDAVLVKALIRHGRTPLDAANFIPIGCYEPAVMGKEISCSAATTLVLPKSIELILEDGDSAPFEEFKNAYFEKLCSEIKLMVKQQKRCEHIWPKMNPSPFLSGTMDECLEKGLDITEGGAKYNTTGCMVSNIANAADSLAAVEQLVYKDKICTLAELKQALAADWKGYEKLQLMAKNRVPKWGNNNDRVDHFAVEIAELIARNLNYEPNARGGTFMASLYGQLVVQHGKLVGALPDGRKAGTPVSKNLDAVISMDKNGVTALMNSVTKIDFSLFPCGSCLDLMLHPSVVKGAVGIHTIAAVIRAFIAKGGNGLQFNIFDAAMLRDAQKHPENYNNLQVRVCGWNARFTDLAPAEQATFIAQAEAIA